MYWLHARDSELNLRDCWLFVFLYYVSDNCLQCLVQCVNLIILLQDFMNECEQQTDRYSDVYCDGNRLSAKYKPSETLDAMMSTLYHRWVGHVAQFCERSEELLRIQKQWEEYEKGVNGLLSWIMEEAEKFSREVTTCGDKGIEDHIMSCKVSRGKERVVLSRTFLM